MKRSVLLCAIVLAGCRPPEASDDSGSGNDSDPDGSDGSTDVTSVGDSADEAEDTGPDPDLPQDCDPDIETPPEFAEVVWEIDDPFPEEAWGMSFHAGALGEENGDLVALYAQPFGPEVWVSDEVRTVAVDADSGEVLRVSSYPRSGSGGWVRGVGGAADGSGFYILDMVDDMTAVVSKVSSDSLHWETQLDPLPTAGFDSRVVETAVRGSEGGFVLAGVTLGYPVDLQDSERLFVHQYEDAVSTPLLTWQSDVSQDILSRLLLGADALTVKRVAAEAGGPKSVLTQTFGGDVVESWAVSQPGTTQCPVALGEESVAWSAFNWTGDLLPRVGLFEAGGQSTQVWETARCGQLFPMEVRFVEGGRLVILWGEDSANLEGTKPNRQYLTLVDIATKSVLDERIFESESSITSVLLVQDGPSPEFLLGTVERVGQETLDGHLMRIRPFGD